MVAGRPEGATRAQSAARQLQLLPNPNIPLHLFHPQPKVITAAIEDSCISRLRVVAPLLVHTSLEGPKGCHEGGGHVVNEQVPRHH